MDTFIDQHISDLISKRRRLHQLAEASNKEEQTAAQIEEWLRETGPDELYTGVGGHGVIAVYGPEGAGSSLMFRAELDALPIPDSRELEHASEDPETGHKCGHDGHMTHLLGLARWLQENRPQKNRVMLLFQPAEETGEGAERVLSDPVFKKLKPERMVALHNLPGYAKHSVIVKKGAFTSASVGVKFHLEGETSHAAHPEDGNSPALAMAALINALSALAGNSFSEHTFALVTIVHARLRLGDIAFGTTPGRGVVMATLRAAETEVLERMIPMAEKQAGGICSAWDLELETEQTEYFQTTVNDDELTDSIKRIADENGLDCIEPSYPFPWSEDFGRFSDASRVMLFGLGAGKEHPQLHHRGYDYPDELIVTALRLFIGLINESEG
ncbi:MAG: amidohydrolase [Balneolia bacterium]|nr:amidohydrolase [Balneolia bacterium]